MEFSDRVPRNANDEAGSSLTASSELHGRLAALPKPLGGLVVHLLLHPVEVARLARLVSSLPKHQVRLSQSDDGRLLASGLARRSRFARSIMRGTTSALIIPADVNAYLAGNSRRTMRKRRNGAIREGATVEPVDEDRRMILLRIANEVERRHPDYRYRTVAPDNSDLFGARRWWVAIDVQGEPLVLAVVAVDGEWAMLRYFRMLRHDSLASAARFLLMDWMVRRLADERVRLLVTDMSPIRMSSGLREFQHRVGFELVRVDLDRASRRQGHSGVRPPIP